jgi:hypothetical protein
MKRDFSAVLNNLEGEPFKDDKGAELTLKKISVDAIGMPLKEDEQLSGEAKFKLYDLASRIVTFTKAAQPTELSAEEISTLKARIAKVYGILAVGPAFKLLDADYVEPATSAA